MSKGEGEDTAQRSVDMDIFRIVTDHFRQDTREFWTRANYFLIAQSFIFSAFAVTYPTLTKDGGLIIFAIPTLGLMIAVLWFFVLRGAIHFLQLWREQVIRLDDELDRFHCYTTVESTVKEKPTLSPSYLTQFTPILFGVTWVTILAFLLSKLI
jgi:hypothetical protein